MFWQEKVRFCKDCKYFRTKDWSAANYECKLEKKTPDGGHTAACNRFEHQGGVFESSYYCKDCARWDDSFFRLRCNKGHPTPKGRDSEKCKEFVKG